MNILIGIIIIIAALFLEAFFSGCETGVISTNRIRLSYLADKKNKSAIIIKGFLDNPERLLGTTLVGVNISVIAGSSVASKLVMQHLADKTFAPLITTLIMLPLILIFGEIIPKAIFRQYADTVSLLCAYPLKIASIILFPLVWLATALSRTTSKMFTRGKRKKNPYVSREETKLLLRETAKQNLLTADEVKMAYEIFDFGKTCAHSVMVPLSNVTAASHKSSCEELTELIAISTYSRIPIYEGNPENVIGTIQVSDLIKANLQGSGLCPHVRPPYFVNEDMPIDVLLKEFQTNQKNIAIVKSKENKAIGIVTLEDVIEEIVGEIEDEYDTGIDQEQSV